MESIIPGLPDDVAKLCLARVPLRLHTTLRSVCRSWGQWLADGTGELAKMRRDAGLKGDQLFLLVCKSMFAETQEGQESLGNYAHLPWLWNGRRYAKFSYRLARAEFDAAGQVVVEHVGEELTCKVSWKELGKNLCMSDAKQKSTD